jgi:hypothetical protein
MAGYDPKRPRPTAVDEADEPAPVEALLAPVAPEVAAPALAAPEVDLRDQRGSGVGERPGVVASEVPVAAAPEEGTANRAVLFAGLAGAGLVALLVAIVLRRRRRS